MSDIPVPVWALTKAKRIRDEGYLRGDNNTITEVFARYIAEHEQPPIDPLVNEAIELVVSEAITRTDNQLAAIRNRQAGNDKVELALRALRRGIELATLSSNITKEG